MKKFCEENKKYIFLLALGFLLLVMPYIINSDTSGGSADSVQQFTDIMKNAEGVGEIEVMTGITKEGEISGVIIVARGAADSAVKKQITEAASAAFNIAPHKVQVFPYQLKRGTDNQ